MAIGDKAAAKGMELVAGSDELNEGNDEINLTRDYIADEIDARSAGDAAKLDAAKIIIAATTPAVVNGALLFKYTA